MLRFDAIWQMEPFAFAQFCNFMQSLVASDITAGPAADAERAGIPIKVQDGVAIIPISGPIMKDAPARALRYVTSTRATQMALQAAAVDDSVETILLSVDSPGGSVSALADLGDDLAAIEKPIVAQVDGMAASAAYYIASFADKIFSGRMDMVGSIGTRLMLYDYSKMFEEAGIKAIPVDTGEFKSAGALGTEITEAQIADFQRIVDGYQADFAAAVMKGRGMSRQQFDAVADGRVFLAEEALSLGLIDGIQSMAETFMQYRAQPRGRSVQAAANRLRFI